MVRIAKAFCPSAAVALVWAFLVGVANFDPEPELARPIGWLGLAFVAIVTQIPLAVAPFVRSHGVPKRAVEILMLPTFVLLAFAVVDLLPRLIAWERLPIWTFAIEAFGLLAYGLAYAVGWSAPSPNYAAAPDAAPRAAVLWCGTLSRAAPRR